MPRGKFEDAPGGDTIMYHVMDDENGYRLCTFGLSYEDHQKYFDDIPAIKCYDDDFLLSSYPKTGTQWLWEMLTMVLTRSVDVASGLKGNAMFEARPTKVIEAGEPPRIFNTHLKVKYLPKQIIEKRLKIVLLVRNPKDVVVSFYHHTKGIRFYEYEGKFENFVQMFMRGDVDYGSYAEYLKEWQTFIKDNPDYPIHLVYYEDLKADCVGQIKKLCKFLEKKVDGELIEQIVDKCQFDKLRNRKQDRLSEEALSRMATVLKDNFSMYRKGEVGDWKNWFTVLQNDDFDRWWAKEAQSLNMFAFKY